jgi:NAD(P)H-dependent flavin oxidoreductase YrpB (nitropropane dioxygenase family)
MASITTELTARLAIDHPILLAPMGDAAGGHLAAAVSRAGGLGLIGGGYADPSWLEPQLDAAGDARVGVGFITFALDERPDTLTMALERTPVAVQLSFGDPGPYADRIHASGALLICQVQTKAEAIKAVRCGVDVIVAQGQDSGDPTAAELLVVRGGDDTTRTEAFDVIRGPAWPDDCDGRALRNDITDRWDREPLGPLDPLGPLGPLEREQLTELYRRAPAEDYSIKALWAGDALDFIHAIEPAGDVIATVIDDALRLLESAAAAVRSEVRP